MKVYGKYKQPKGGKRILTFKELEKDKKFIVFPKDGDNEGHGGYKTPYNIYKKINYRSKNFKNAEREIDGITSNFPLNMKILPVQ